MQETISNGIRERRPSKPFGIHVHNAALTAHLDLKEAMHIGHSTGGDEVVHFIARHGEGRVAKAVIISAVPPLMLKTAANPRGLPKGVFDDLQTQLAANRSKSTTTWRQDHYLVTTDPARRPEEDHCAGPSVAGR